MARYIDIDKMNKWTKVDHDCCVRQDCKSTEYDCNECFYNNGGAEDVAPIVHANWVDIKVAEGEPPVVSCPICEMCFCDIINNHHYMYHYCPNCGAKMDKERLDGSKKSQDMRTMYI